MSRSAAAEELFRGHANCAQAVLIPFAADHGVDSATASHIAAGFGGGIARLQGTCGALTGACMALGIAIGAQEPDAAKAKDATSAAFREFQKRFVGLHGATTCRDLLNVDLNTEEGRAAHAQNNLRETICVPCVRDAAQIVDDLLTPTA
ncbi:MAG: C_GCAxxG_C_C family protein [Ignavibacteriae bacterium]|nr:C_GCAxxG_C_C family protein [Ignavibacteriota bacterium]